MNIANLYRKLKQILNDSNIALVNKGLNEVNKLNEIPIEIKKFSINRLPYFLKRDAIILMESDLEDVTTIGDKAFYNYKSLTSVTIPDSVTTIGDSAFEYCYSLTEVTIGDSVTTIGDSAFLNCYNLTEVTIPDSVTTIGDKAFFDCRRLTSVTIGNSVTVINSGAFSYCNSLTDIYLKPITPPTIFGNSIPISSDTIIYVPIGSGDAYRNATNWSEFADKIVEE